MLKIIHESTKELLVLDWYYTLGCPFLHIEVGK